MFSGWTQSTRDAAHSLAVTYEAWCYATRSGQRENGAMWAKMLQQQQLDTGITLVREDVLEKSIRQWAKIGDEKCRSSGT